MEAWSRGGRVALVGARLVDGLGGRPLEDATIVIDGPAISAVGGDVPVPAGVAVVDLGGATVTPGVVDAHVHLAFAPDPVAVLRGGVTAVRDLGWPTADFARIAERATDASLLVLHVGRILTAPGGYPTKAGWAPRGTGLEVRTAAQARRAVDEMVGGGAVAVKIAMEDRVGPVFSAEVLRAIVERAASWGRPTTVHAGSGEAVEACLAAGVDELAHVPFHLAGSAADLPARCAAAGMGLVPTLHCRHSDRADEQGAAQEFLRRFIAAGGSVRYGTDLGNAHTAPGVDAAELQHLVDAGMSPAQVVVAATSAAAAAIGAGGLTGRVGAGLRADLLVLESDPLQDVTALSRARWVVAAGRLYEGRG